MGNYDICWYEGMFLTPQVFQQQDLIIQKKLKIFNNIQHQFNYGYFEYFIAQDALETGVVCLQSAKGIFPDKTYFELSEPLYYKFQELVENELLYLTMPLNLSYHHNRKEDCRYIVDQVLVKDLDLQSFNEIQIKVLKPNLSLKTSKELHNNLLIMGLVDIKYANKDQEIFINKDYIPPILKISASQKISAMVDNIFAKLNFFKLKIIEKIKNLRLMQDENLNRFKLLIIIRILNTLQNYIDNKYIKHPYDLYYNLIYFINEFSAFEKEIILNKIESYNHDNIIYIFENIINIIQDKINEKEQVDEKVVNYKSINNNLIVFESIDMDFIGNYNLIIKVENKMDCYNSYYENFDKIVKFSGLKKINDIVKYGLLGLPIISINNELEEKSNKVYKKFKIENNYIKKFYLEENDVLAMYIPDEVKTLSFSFFLF